MSCRLPILGVFFCFEVCDVLGGFFLLLVRELELINGLCDGGIRFCLLVKFIWGVSVFCAF